MKLDKNVAVYQPTFGFRIDAYATILKGIIKNIILQHPKLVIGIYTSFFRAP